MHDFRQRLDQNYASLIVGASGLDVGEVPHSVVRVFNCRFPDWLPADRTAPVLDAAFGAGGLLDALKDTDPPRCRGLPEPGTGRHQPSARINVDAGEALSYLDERHGSFALISALDIIDHLSEDEAVTFLDDLPSQALQLGRPLILRTPSGATACRVQSTTATSRTRSVSRRISSQAHPI